MYPERQPQMTTQQARHLSPQHFERPKTMFYALCERYDIIESRDKLWTITKAFLASEEANDLTGEERGDYLNFYEMLEASLEAIYLINERHVEKEYKMLHQELSNTVS